MNTRLPFQLSVIALGLGMATAPAFASSESDQELLDLLLKKGTITQQEYDELNETTKGDVDVSTKGGHLKFKSKDDEFEFQVGGRVQVDTAFFKNDPALNNGSEIRRARLFMSGKVFNDWKFKAQFGFAGNETDIEDAYIRYTGFDVGDITVGHFKEPWSLEELTSSKYITFMERALPVEAFAPSRKLGAGFGHHAKNWTATVGAFANGESAENDNDNEGHGVAARATYTPIIAENKLIHLGAYGEYRDPQDSTVRYRTRPESHIANVRLVDTGDIEDVDHTVKWGLEAASVWGPYSVQGEYMSVDNDLSGGSDPDFNGWYAYGSWFITGESRAYKNGVFSRVKPKSIVGKGGHGAWELAARYSDIDLNDSGIEGGEEKDLTIGVNWYATPTIRFMGNYVNVLDLNDSPTQSDSDKPDIFELRAQIDF